MSGFIKELEGRRGLFAVFEDDGETGYLYIYFPQEQKILFDLNIYTRGSKIQPREDDVELVWTRDYTLCGARVYWKLRGYIDLKKQKRENMYFIKPDDQGINDSIFL
jgi:hypothetical protein